MLVVDSFKKRYLYKAFANGVLAMVNVVIQSIIPRGLGAAQYGNFNYLTDFFTQLLGTINAGSSTGFYTKISKRPQETKLIVFYFGYIVLAILIAGCLVAVSSWGSWSNSLWPQLPVKYVYAAVIFAGLTWMFASLNDITDAYGLTVPAEITKIAQRLLGLGLIAILFLGKWLNLDSIFYFQYAVILLGMFFLLQVIFRSGQGAWEWRLNKGEIYSYCREIYNYSRPLFGYALVAVVTGIFDRWFLQTESGSIAQGFYSLSYKVGALCFILTGAMTPLIMREFSLAHHQKDIDLMAKVFRRYIPLMYAITTLISCFMAVNAGKLAVIFGGKEFNTLAAIVPIMIMSLYPMHQAYGQLSNAVFFSTDQTPLYAKVSIIFMIIGVPLTYFLIAAPRHHGLGIGATGLALKAIGINILLTNVLLYFNAHYLKLRFSWYLLHQLLCFIAFLFLAAGTTFLVDHYLLNGGHIIAQIFLSGCCYCLFCAILIYFFPIVLGLGRENILKALTLVSKRLFSGGN